jgi:integrase
MIANANYTPMYTGEVHPKDWAEFKAELLALYGPGLRAKATLRCMEHLIRCIDAIGGVASTADLSCELVGRLIASRPASNSPNSTRGFLRNLSALCGYAARSGYLARSPFAVRNLTSWVRPAPNLKKKHCSRAEIARVLEHMRQKALADGWTGWRDKRTYALTAGLAMTGARMGEMVWLKAEDVDFEQDIIRIVSRAEHKLKTERSADVIGLPKQLKEIWQAWLPHRLSRPPEFRVEDPRCAWMFPTSRLKAAAPWTSGAPGGRPTARIKATAAEVDVYMTPLSLRHSMGTHMLFWGAGKGEIQRQLRHSNQATQAFYTHDDYDNIRALADRIHY